MVGEGHRGACGPGNQQAGMPTLAYAHPQLTRGVLYSGFSPQWKPGPLFPAPNPDPVPTPETQASLALGLTALFRSQKSTRRFFSIMLHDGGWQG